MARDKKASFKFTSQTVSLPLLKSDIVASDKLATVITYSGSSAAYTSRSDVFRSANMITADAASFGNQADTPASGSSDLVGINAQNQDMFLKVIVTNNNAVANVGTPQLQVFGSDTFPTSGSPAVEQPANALTNATEVSPAVNITTTASASAVYYLPVMTSKKYLQLQLNGTGTGVAAGTVTIVMAALVNGRDGSVSL